MPDNTTGRWRVRLVGLGVEPVCAQYGHSPASRAFRATRSHMRLMNVHRVRVAFENSHAHNAENSDAGAPSLVINAGIMV